jgi:hypothetical protein
VAVLKSDLAIREVHCITVTVVIYQRPNHFRILTQVTGIVHWILVAGLIEMFTKTKKKGLSVLALQCAGI